MISDIGEGALVLPLEPSYYWVSTNNGDDNQLFKAVLEQCDNDFWLALQRVVQLAPNGAAAFMRAREDHELAQREEQEQAPTPFSNALDTAFGTVERSSANQ